MHIINKLAHGMKNVETIFELDSMKKKKNTKNDWLDQITTVESKQMC